jgi:RNA polymerase sigma-70 factor (ECF subfamily)
MTAEANETQELLVQARVGGDAVNRLLGRYRESLRRMVRSRLDRAMNRRVDASDVVQDVLFEASQRLADYLNDPRMPFGLWLRHIAQDRIIDLHRRHRTAARRSLDREQPLAAAGDENHSSPDYAARLVDPEPTPAAASLRKELEGRFLLALEQLEEGDRDLLLMRHFEGLTNGEVAELLGLSPSAAGMRHLRALRRLRVVLGEAGSGDVVHGPDDASTGARGSA